MTLTHITESGSFIVEDFDSGRRIHFARHNRGAVVQSDPGPFVLDKQTVDALVAWLEDT